MVEKEEQIVISSQTNETTVWSSGPKSHNPGLRALLAVKDFNANLEKDYTQLLQIESELSDLNTKGLLMIEATNSEESISKWKKILLEENNSLQGINDTLTVAKRYIEQKAKDGFSEVWKQQAQHLTELKLCSRNAVNAGLVILPEALHPQWEKEFSKIKEQLVRTIIMHVDSCRVLLQMIERYTPDELNAITKIIVDHIPLDFTYQEAVEYQNDYYDALLNFKKEFKEEKNLWDKFLDILAGGTHQPPSERIMMERWLEGEKGDLE